jgi:hypothetical protein
MRKDEKLVFVKALSDERAFLYDKNKDGSIIGRQKNLYFH